MTRQLLLAGLASLGLVTLPGCTRTTQPHAGTDETAGSPAPGNLGASLLGSRWVVLSADGRELAAARGEVDIHFPEPGRIAGQGPCNRYMGSYDEPDGGFRVGQAASTMMACEEEAMDDEQAFLALLGEVERAWIDGDRLQLVTGDGRQIHAERR